MKCMLFMLMTITLEPFKIESPEEIYRIAQEKAGTMLYAVYPQETTPSDPSYVWIGYTPYEFVVYIKNFQKNVNASERRRDSPSLENDDSVGVTLDTMGRKNEVYIFLVNAIGTQGDGVKTPTGNLQWDGDWKAFTKITDYGWEALFIIPFRTITYSTQNWGIDVVKFRPGQLRIHRLVNSVDFHSLAGNLADLKLDFSYIQAKGRDYGLTIIPSFRIEREMESVTKYRKSLGITTRFKKGVGDLLDFTFKPDFSEVDVDIQEVSYDRLPINYPEKRLFFIEGSELLNSPFSLIRTRNITSPTSGIKFYTKGKNYSFSTLYLNDTFYKDVIWGRFTYTPFKDFVFGSFYSASNVGYNMGSFDLSYTLKSLNSVFVFEGARNFSNLSSYYNFNFSRVVLTGLSWIFSIEEIGKDFKNPLNEISFYFDNVRKIDITTVFSYPLKRGSQNFILKPGMIYSGYRVKDKRNMLSQSFLTNLMLLYGPWSLNIGYQSNLMNYLQIDSLDKTAKTYFIYLGYQRSSSKYGYLYYSQGRYLGGEFQAFSSRIFWPFVFFNLGMNFDYFKTLYDDLRLWQAYQTFPVAKNLLVKSYIGYTIDKINKNKLLSSNIIIAFEPTNFTKIYFVINKKLTGTIKSRLHHFYEKEVFKLQFSLDLK